MSNQKRFAMVNVGVFFWASDWSYIWFTKDGVSGAVQ